MKPQHIAIIVESAHGHIHPTLGIASCLIRHGYRVSYAVGSYFASRVEATGAQAFVYSPLDYRKEFIPKVKEGKHNEIRFTRACWKEFEEREVRDSLVQIETLYLNDRPDLVIYDCRNLAGRELALKYKIPKIEHSPLTIGGDDKSFLDHTYDEDLVIISMPICFQRNPEMLDKRFQFIDPIYTHEPSMPFHQPDANLKKTILVSQTTGGFPSKDFFEMAITAFFDVPSKVVLSIGDSLDPGTLPALPENFSINQFTRHLDILEHASLLVGHGGPGSTLEALYCGVPVLAVVPGLGSIFDSVALRVVELGFGASILSSEVSAELLRESALSLLENTAVLSRVQQMKQTMRRGKGCEQVIRLIKERL